MVALGMLHTLILFVVATVLAHTLSVLIKRHLYKLQHGCQPIRHTYTQRFPWLGQDFLSAYEGAQKENRHTKWMKSLLVDGQRSRNSGDRFVEHRGRTFSVRVWGQLWLFTSDPDNIRVVNTSPAVFSASALRKPANVGWIGDGMFISGGSRWKQARGLFKPMFARIPSADLARFEKHLDRFLDLLAANAASGDTVDLQPRFKRMFLDVNTEVMFGQSANSQGPGDALFDIESFEKSFEESMYGMYRKASLGAWLTLRDENSGWIRSYKRVHGVLDTLIDNALAEYGKNVTQTGSEAEAPASMVAELAAVSQNRTFLRDQLLNVFIGAKDTAAIGICDIFFQLARHPRVWAKLRKEVLRISHRSLTFELLKSVRYLQHVISEGLRLEGPAALSLRCSTQDCVLPRGGGLNGQSPIFVPAGTRVETEIGALHRDPKWWAPDPDSFRPERWEKLVRKWEYIPFLGGNRICPAQQLLLTQYACILVRFAQRFETIENRDPVFEFIPEIVFSVQSKNGVKVALQRSY